MAEVTKYDKCPITGETIVTVFQAEVKFEGEDRCSISTKKA